MWLIGLRQRVTFNEPALNQSVTVTSLIPYLEWLMMHD